MAADRLRENPRRSSADNPPVPRRGGESSRILSVVQTGGGESSGDGVARRNSEVGSRDAGLWLSADHGGAANAGAG